MLSGLQLPFGRIQVSDFGLAREVDEDDAYYRSRGGQLPVRCVLPA